MGVRKQNKNSFNAETIHLVYSLLNLCINCLIFLKEMFPLESHSQPSSYSERIRSVAKKGFLKMG